ncbi:hypothetical protein M405DRAFT_413639 [Rhizopogon salebrosus TDB-379]|nr:hypothetical protein M405DRAFT_413639 [Rhizopogon salebrosus TDB-379]
MGEETLQWEIPEDILAAACDALASQPKTKADPSRSNQMVWVYTSRLMYILAFNQNTEPFLDVEITDQCHRTADRRGINRSSGEVTHLRSQSSANANSLSYTRFHAVHHFINRIRPSAGTERKQGHRSTRRTPEVQCSSRRRDIPRLCC